MRERLTAKKKALALTIHTRDELFAAIKNGATLITPNNRLSNQLLHAFFKHTPTIDVVIPAQLGNHFYDGSSLNLGIDSRLRGNDMVSAVKPRCMPYQAFLREQYKRARHLYAQINHPILLTSHQQRYLWRQIMAQHQEDCNDGLLAEVQEAWVRCQHWQIDNNHPAFAQTPQTRRFQQWQDQLQQRLNELGALTEEQLATHLLSYPDLFDMRSVIWACFDDYTPQQQILQEAMIAAGCEQYDYDLVSPRDVGITSTHQYPAKDSQDENLQMIQWLKLKLAAGEQRIAVVVPDLQTCSHSLQRLLQRHIPAHLFNISLGQSLVEHPLVAHALQWLSLDKQTISNYQARLLLHSSYLAGSQAEFAARADAMQNCKMLQESFISFSSWIKTIRESTPQLAELLHTVVDYPHEASPREWANIFKTRLIHLGFPGDYPLISSAYQCFQRFMMLFDELLQLSVVSPRMNTSQALEALQGLAKSTIFQPQTPTTPIQILGLLEASGCNFDSIWVSGLTDQCLPQKTRLSAFIPLSIQHEYLMPHSSPLRELQFAQQLLQRLQNSSHETVFSYPRLTGDSPNLPSPLISHLPKLTPQETTENSLSSRLVARNELYSIPLAATEPVSGGTALLGNQAKCPFRAFATHRLHASPALTITDGPDLSERGQVIHKIMELLWQRLGSQRNLLALTHEALQQHIKDVIDRALSPLFDDHKLCFPPLVQEVELSRLHQMVNTCLEWEKQRPPFEVEALEKSFIIQLADMDFRVRIDRLDSVAGKKWVIDYKSSLPINKPWNEERPEAPQLLLYTLLDRNINTLLFLQLKAGQIFCSGLSEDNLPVRGISPLKKDEDWSVRQEEWQQQLTQLATEFRNGHCPPKPSRAATCQQCDFPNLCRVGHM